MRRFSLVATIVIFIIITASLSSLAACGPADTTSAPAATTSSPAPSITNSTTTTAIAPTASPATPVVTQRDSYTIADSTGDWGYPSPYAHYSRGPGYIRMSFIFETLAWKDADGFIPQLAESWAYDEADDSYTFYLQENVTWHDGTPFTAADVVFTFNYTETYPYQWVDNSIIDRAEALNDYTVKLYLAQQYAPFFQDVAGAQPILPKHIWETVTSPTNYLEADACIGTGPYTLADYDKAQGIYLYQAFDDYYLGTPLAKEIRFVKIAAEMNPAALKQGTVDSASIPAEVVDDIRAAGFTVITDRPSWNGKLTINHQKAPFDSVSFRQALAYAIDRQSLVDIVFRGHAVVGSPGMVPPTSTWFNPATPQYDYNAAESRRILESLGYVKNGSWYEKDGQKLSVSLIAAADYRDLGQFITAQLEAVGIDVDFQTFEAKTIDNKVGDWDFDLSIYGHGGLYEPSFLQRCIIGQGFNSARYTDNTELTTLLNAQLTEMDPSARKDMIDKIQVLYAENVPALTLYYPVSYWAYDSSLPLYYTMDGVSIGVPIPLNRMSFVGR